MNTEQIIAEIEWLEHLFSLPDNRPRPIAERKVEKQRDNEARTFDLRLRLPRLEWLEHLFSLPDNRPISPTRMPETRSMVKGRIPGDLRFLLWRPDDI